MTERSIVVSENQLMIMLDDGENPNNTSMNVLLRDLNSASSQISNNGKMYQRMESRSIDKLPKNKVMKNFENQKEVVHRTKEEEKQVARQNYTARDNTDLAYENLNEIFQEFKEEKYGIKKDGQRTTQNKDLTVLSQGQKKMTIQQFLSLKNQKFVQQKNSKRLANETQEEREKRLFDMIKQRQSLLNDSGLFNKEVNDLHHNNSTEDINDQMEVMFPPNANIDLEHINTSTFGYAINHNQRKSQYNHSVEAGLSNENGMLSTVNSKMNKRYITNQLTESESSIDGNLESIEHIDFNKTGHSKGKSLGSPQSQDMSDVEPIMIDQEDNELKMELMQRILNRFMKKTEIIDMKAGFIAFIKN